VAYKKLKARNGTMRGAPIKDEREIALVLSSNIVALGQSTTAQLTPPSGKTTSNFTTGRIQEDMNPAAAIDIASGNYTEIEWCVKATDLADSSITYQFRVLADNVVLDTYSVTPQITLNTAVNYTRTLTDSVDVSDVQGRAAKDFRLLADSISTLDQLIKGVVFGRVAQDSVSVTDALLRAVQTFRLLHEDVAASDTLLRFVLLYRKLADGINVSDVLVKTFTDGSIRIVSRVLQDNIDVNDLCQRAVSMYRRTLDVADTSDTLIRLAQCNRYLADTLTVSESLAQISNTQSHRHGCSRGIRYRRPLYDAATVTD
jgi:hypothetical protein